MKLRSQRHDQKAGSQGFYKRRRGILEHLEAGTISLLDLAVHDYLNLKANLVVGSGSSLPSGVCITSAAAIHAMCPSQISERAIQRSLEHLKEIGWIKRWNVRGKRGNYPVLVCRASVHDLSGNEYRVNGELTTDWRNPVLEAVGDGSAVSREADAKLSGDREVRDQNKEKREVSHDRTTDRLSLTGLVWDSAEWVNSNSLPAKYRGFVALVEGNQPSPQDVLATWGGAILDLCYEHSIEYPKLFYRRVSEARRRLADRQSAQPTKRHHDANDIEYKTEVRYA